jgi:CRP/FNR family transcriptional regulator
LKRVGNDRTITKSQLTELIPEYSLADEATLDQLLAESQVVNLEQDQFVFNAGDLCNAFLILLDGSVRVQLISPNGREITLYRLGPGGSCILTTSCLLSQEHYPAEAIAESDVRALAISTNAFQSALDSSTWFRKFVFDGFSTRLTNVIQKIEDIAFTSIDVRLATILLALDDSDRLDATHQAIAIELGTAREVVSRHLKRFEAEGWLKLGRGTIEILDRRRVEDLAGSVSD